MDYRELALDLGALSQGKRRPEFMQSLDQGELARDQRGNLRGFRTR